MTTSRTCAIPASMDDGCASIVVERAYTKPPSSLGGGAPAAPPVSLTTFLRRISRGNGQAAALVLQLAQGDTGRHPIARFGRSPLRSDQLGRPQMGESELELAVVELLGADLADLLILEGRSRVSAALHRLEAVEGRTGHAASGCTVYQQAGAAEAVKCLELGQDGHLVKLDALVELIRRQLHPRGPCAGTIA